MSSNSKSPMKIMLVGGGTGGHFYPLIAIAEALRDTPQNPDLYYVGPSKYDKEALDQNAISFVYVPAGKRRRYFSIMNFLDLFRTGFGFALAVLRLFFIYPDVVVSKGGYTSVPVVLAAWFLRIPVIVHESDSVFGNANKLASRFARRIITAYETAKLPPKHNEKIQNLGIPIRKVMHNPPTKDAIQSLGVDPNRPIILVLGGSQGAERLNEALLASLDDFLKMYTVLHQTGEQNLDTCKLSAEQLIPDPEVRKYYHPIDFIDPVRLNNAYHLSSVVISRAGSTILYEIAIHKKPTIIVPIPEEISHDQRSNAYEIARYGAGVVIEERNLTEGILLSEIERIVQNQEIYDSMVRGAEAFARPDTAEQMAIQINQVAEAHIK